MIVTLAKVPDAVGLLAQPVTDATAQPTPAWSWTLPLIAGAMLVGVALVCSGAWFAWTRRQATRDQRELATHMLAKRAGLSTPELQAMHDLVACVQGTQNAQGQNATTLGLMMAPHAAAELARVIEGDGFDRKQLGRALERLGASVAIDPKAKSKGTKKPIKGVGANRAVPAKGNEAIAMRARAILAAIDRAKQQGFFDAKPDAKPAGKPDAASTRAPAPNAKTPPA